MRMPLGALRAERDGFLPVSFLSGRPRISQRIGDGLAVDQGNVRVGGFAVVVEEESTADAQRRAGTWLTPGAQRQTSK